MHGGCLIHGHPRAAARDLAEYKLQQSVSDTNVDAKLASMLQNIEALGGQLNSHGEALASPAQPNGARHDPAELRAAELRTRVAIAVLETWTPPQWGLRVDMPVLLGYGWLHRLEEQQLREGVLRLLGGKDTPGLERQVIPSTTEPLTPEREDPTAALWRSFEASPSPSSASSARSASRGGWRRSWQFRRPRPGGRGRWPP